MTNTKEKLAASVREAKATQAPGAVAPEPIQPAKPVARPKAATAKPKPAPRKPAATVRKSAPATAKAPGADAQKTSPSESISESGTALFPERVWPD